MNTPGETTVTQNNSTAPLTYYAKQKSNATKTKSHCESDPTNTSMDMTRTTLTIIVLLQHKKSFLKYDSTKKKVLSNES